MFSFDETAEVFAERNRGQGVKLGDHPRFSIRQVDPAELSPGEFAHTCRDQVERDDVRLLVIDSLNGYLMAMPEERFLILHLHELLTYLGQRGVTTLLLLAQNGMVGRMESPVDVSYLADTVLLLRFFEDRGRVRKALSVLKRRVGPHEDTIRELQITGRGVEIGDPLTAFQGVLTGVPILRCRSPETPSGRLTQMAAGHAHEERILVLAPTGRDAALADQTLTRAGLAADVLCSADALAGAIEEGAGAVLIAEEALSPRTVELLAGALERQPPWSDLPLVVFAAPMDRQASSARLDWMSERLGNVTLVERPVRVATMVTAVRAALRARHRQYAARATMKALEAREEELKLAGERKDEFLAMLAHELRNPMAALSMALELLELGGNDPVRAARNQAIARRQLGHLVRLVDDLLDVSRITRGSFELRKSELDLNKVLDDALSVAQPLLETRGILLTVDRPMAPVPVHADSTRLEQVLTNLLSNSAKFTESGGTVVVSLVQTDHQAVLRVHDTGRGIPARMTDQVFEPFVQVNPGLDRSKGGLGLGLTLVKRLVQMHGGTVTASSGGTGQGSTFEVRLPLRIDQHGAKAEGARTGESAPSRRILVVEDSADVRETLADFLGSLGHSVELAASGPEGAEKLLTLQPDVGLVDIGLPGMDGYEVARVVRTRPEGRSLFLVALTGYGGPEAEASARRAGFDLHLVKPVDGRQLLEILRRGRSAPPGEPGSATGRDEGSRRTRIKRRA